MTPCKKRKNLADKPPPPQPKRVPLKERRAFILSEILRLGHEDFVSRTEMGKKFHVNPAQITRDIQHLRENVPESVKRISPLQIYSTHQKAIKKLLEKGKEPQATRLALQLDDWVNGRHSKGINLTQQTMLSNQTKTVEVKWLDTPPKETTKTASLAQSR